MNKKVFTPLAVSSVLVLGGGAWLLLRAPTTATTTSQKSAERGSVWSANTSHRYQFSYRSEESVRPLADVGGDRVAAGDAFSASLHLEGELLVDASPEPLGPVTLRIAKLDRAELTIGEAPVPDLVTILSSGELRVGRGPRGVFTNYTHAEGANPLLVQTLRALAMRLQVAAPESDSETGFEILEELPHGPAQSRYSKAGDRRWTRLRPRYERLDVAANQSPPPSVELSAEAKLGFDADGTLASVEDLEAITVTAGTIEVLRGTSSSSFRLLARGALLTHAPLAGPTRPLAEVPTSEGLAQRLAAERTEGLTRAAAVELLKRHMNEGTLPDHRRALWRLTGLLEQEPELSRDLKQLLLEPTTSSKGRALLLDVLVSVGHEEAQAAVREALDSEVSRQDPSRSVHFQRLGLIDAPTIETLRFARQELDRAQASGGLDARMLAAYTSAAVAGHARESDEPALREEAAAVGTAVSAMLAAAPSPAEQRHLIKALSNVKDTRFQAQISSFTTSAHDGVRQSVARAMREPATADGLRTLITLVRDRDPFVQTEAIRAMDKHVLEDADWDSITRVIGERGLHKRNHRILLDFVKYRRASSHAATTRLLEAMLAQPLEGEVAGAVRLLLAQGADAR